MWFFKYFNLILPKRSRYLARNLRKIINLVLLFVGHEAIFYLTLIFIFIGKHLSETFFVFVRSPLFLFNKLHILIACSFYLNLR